MNGHTFRGSTYCDFCRFFMGSKVMTNRAVKCENREKNIYSYEIKCKIFIGADQEFYN